MATVQPLCSCLSCGKSSNAKNVCAFEEKEKMAFCPTFIKMKSTTKK